MFSSVNAVSLFADCHANAFLKFRVCEWDVAVKGLGCFIGRAIPARPDYAQQNLWVRKSRHYDSSACDQLLQQAGATGALQKREKTGRSEQKWTYHSED